VVTSQRRALGGEIHAIGVAEVTYHSRHQEYGGPKSDQKRRMRELEFENQRLTNTVADSTLEKFILTEPRRIYTLLT
jgi:putative transposase